VIVKGRYEITRDGTRIADERFRFLGHTIESDVQLDWPAPHAQKLRITLDTARKPVEIEVELVQGGETTRGRYRTDRASRMLRVLIQPPQGASIEQLLPFSEQAEVGFPSPLFSFVTVGRLRLRPGERRDVDAVVVQVPTLMPEPRRQRYQRLPDVELVTPQAGSLVAADYVLEPLEGPPLEIRFQSNLLGLPLRMRMRTPDAVGEYVLVE